jgi:hypothetical protein
MDFSFLICGSSVLVLNKTSYMVRPVILKITNLRSSDKNNIIHMRGQKKVWKENTRFVFVMLL